MSRGDLERDSLLSVLMAKYHIRGQISEARGGIIYLFQEESDYKGEKKNPKDPGQGEKAEEFHHSSFPGLLSAIALLTKQVKPFPLNLNA